MATEADKVELESEIRALTEEKDELEKALPAHGLKPSHLLRIEELEETIAAKMQELAELTN